MKLLLDQNISFRVVTELESTFPGTQDVGKLGLENRPDREIWQYAKREQFVLVTFDSDFYDLSLAYGHPPKIIWLKTGNMTTSSVIKILREKVDQIQSFINENELSCLEIVD